MSNQEDVKKELLKLREEKIAAVLSGTLGVSWTVAEPPPPIGKGIEGTTSDGLYRLILVEYVDKGVTAWQGGFVSASPPMIAKLTNDEAKALYEFAQASAG